MEEKEVQAAQQEPQAEASPETVETVTAEALLGGFEIPQAQEETDRAQLKAVLEAIIYILNEPMPADQIAQALDQPPELVTELLNELVEETANAGRGVFVREVAGGYQLATKPEHHEQIRQFVKNLKQPLKLSQAALETLAVIAYKQPITMPEILEIRGVQGGGVVKTLIDRKLITTAGRKNVIGKPILYKTTKEFLTQFGLKDLSELPSLKEFEEIRRQSLADEEIVSEAPAAMPAETPAEILAAPSSEAAQPGEDTAPTESGQENNG